MAHRRDSDCVAYRFLQIAFIIVPIVAGLDKFFHYLAHWTHYLSPYVSQVVHYNNARFMMFVGIIEIIVGIGNIIVPKVFGFITAGWLALIIINLLLLGHFWDIALRDLGLCLGAVALGIMGLKHNTFK